MKKATILLSILLIYTTVFCINHMDLMFWMQGSQAYGQFGQGLAALDFNGDGHDDLAVLQNGWQPDSLSSQPSLRYGRILFYYGGTGFDGTPEFSIEGTYDGHLFQAAGTGYLVNLGDVNGDGYDDLGVRGYTQGTGSSDTWRPFISVYFGGENPSHQPGYYKSFPAPESGGYAEINPVGDVNNDGIDDFSYAYLSGQAVNGLSRTALVMGGSMTEVILRQFNNAGLASIDPSGDVNNDGFDDFIILYYTGPFTNTLYFGSSNVVPADSLVLYSDTTNIVWRTKGLGDLNGDGIDDFTGLISWYNIYVWYGNGNLSVQSDFTLSPTWSGTSNTDRGLVHGDINGDGFDDVIGSAPTALGQYGGFRIWLGGAYMNGTSDLTIGGPQPGMLAGMLLGTGMAAGDFNADGYCDVAASAPHSQTFDETPGRVYIFLGNAQLEDTTVANEDDTIPVTEESRWDIDFYPNPVHNTIAKLKVQFIGSGYKTTNSIKLEIYNIKGQKLLTRSFSNKELTEGAAELTLKDYHQGCYVAVVKADKQLLATKKIYIMTN